MARVTIAARWPAGVLLTMWSYVWRTTPIHRREEDGDLAQDAPPALPAGTPTGDVQVWQDGSGRFLRRRYRVRVAQPQLGAAGLMERLGADPNRVAPWSLAHFHKEHGSEHVLKAGDVFTVRMPGPWDGPVRVVEVTPTSFRLATLDGHLEAGQIEWRAADDPDGALRFEIESWSRPGDAVSNLAHHKLRMAKEVQLHMWTSVLENVVKEARGRRAEPLDIHTRVVDV